MTEIEKILGNIFKLSENQGLIGKQQQPIQRSQQSSLASKRLKDLEYDVPSRLWNGLKNMDYSGDAGEKYRLITKAIGSGFNVILHGPAGTGKSQLSVAIGHRAASMGLRTRFVSLQDFKMSIGRMMAQNDGSLEEHVERMNVTPFLILDEIDSFLKIPSSGTTYWQDILFQILNKRYGEQKDTIMTSNLSKNELNRFLYPQLRSRIIETGGIIDTSAWKNHRTPDKSPLRLASSF